MISRLQPPFSLFNRHSISLAVAMAFFSASHSPAEPYATTYGSPELVSVVSRQIHAATPGSGGRVTIDLPVALAGPPTVEARIGASATYTFIATFDQPISSAKVAVSKGTAKLVSGARVSGSTVTVDVATAIDNQIIEVLLTSVTSASLPKLGSGGFRVEILHGDANGDGVVNAADIAAIQAAAGQPITVANASCDTNRDGIINANDVRLVTTYAREFRPVPFSTANRKPPVSWGKRPSVRPRPISTAWPAWVNPIGSINNFASAP